MSNYQIRLSRKAEKILDSLPNQVVLTIYEAPKKLSINPKPYEYKKLNKHAGYRIRIGDYRAIYTIKENELIVLVLTIGRRKDVYE
jgi:mRNA interferase RelE/StbE